MEAAKPAPPHISPRGMWVSKLILRIIQFALAIAIIGCVGSILSTGIWSIPTLIVIVPQAAVSAIWSLAEGICILARGGRRGIHPGANVALDLLLWLGLVAGTVLLWILGVATAIASDVVDSYDSSYDYYNYYDDAVSRDLRSVATMGKALVALAAVLTILHFVTFIIACVETNQRNNARKVVYVTGTQYPQAPQHAQPAQPVPYSPTPPQQVYQHNGMKA